MAVKPTQIIPLIDILEDWKKDLKSGKFLSKSDLNLIGNLMIKQIRERTQSGIGVNDSGKEYKLSNRPYSKRYAEKKGVSRSNVDLTDTGDMLENMSVKKVTNENITLAVAGKDYGKLRGAEEGVLQKAGKGTKLVQRPFFHLSNNDIKKIQNSDEFRRILERALNRK